MKHKKPRVICIYSKEGGAKRILLEVFTAFVRKALHR